MKNVNEMVQIHDKEIRLKEFNNQRVVTFRDIDTVHERPSGTARKNFNRNKRHFIESIDYFVRNSHEAKIEFGITAPNGVIIITESGYLMLVKSFTDDLAWKVQRQLVNCYFKVKEQGIDIEVTEQEQLNKKDYLKILDCISRTSNEGLPLLKSVLNKLAPGEFENVQPSINMNMKVKFPNDFSNKLLLALQKNNMCQKELAEKVGCAKSSINNYVHGRSKPSEYVIDKISEVLNIDF